MNNSHQDLIKKLEQVEIFLLDVDGVLTDGNIIYNDDGIETKAFNVKDGLGIRLLESAGIKTVIITGRSSKALLHRCEDLGISEIFDGVTRKAPVLDIILSKFKIQPEQTAFMGDDLPDLPLMDLVGLPIAVADAHEAVRQKAHMVTAAKGGKGAVREVCESILKAKNVWERALGRFE
ncbi:MAG: HAD hydrolase family protein [Deltaproteobacteria bacterium]|nr:HAD hydrolase family protein [Deltaproteobacteria bacterium]